MSHHPYAALASWSAELLSKANRVRSLIGSKHWLTDGRHKENVLADFLKRHLPPSLNVTTGFVCPPTPEPHPSREIDIIVADFDASPPWFNESGVSIISPSSLLAQIQVKTTFGDTELLDILSSTATTYKVTDPYIDATKIWSGGFFFSPGETKTVDDARRLVEKCLHKATQLNDSGRLIMSTHIPRCIVVLNCYTILIKAVANVDPRQRASVSIFQDRELGPAVFIESLFSHYLASKRRDSNTDLETLIARAKSVPIRQFPFDWDS